jgi:GNAT superfamily N-acetyltransferase
VEKFLRAHSALRAARRGELMRPADHLGFLAWSGDDLVGVATYVVSGPSCELLTLHATERFAGTGSALLAAVRSLAERAGCTRLWVVTTNDNVDALRFYQRRGFRLTALRPGAVEESRVNLKPEIPTSGAYGIRLCDELELEMDLSSSESLVDKGF